MKSLGEIKQLLIEKKSDLRTQYNVKKLGLFGSLVRGETQPASDIDILVEFDRPVGLFLFLELEDYLARLCGARIDLVSRKALKPGIGERILREAVFV